MRTTPPSISGFSSLSFPSFSLLTLPNGLEVRYFNSGDDPITRMAVIWDAGSLDVENPSALAMLAAMLTEGSTDLSGKEISDIFEGCGAWVKIQESPHALMGVLHSLNHTAPEVFPLFAKVLTQSSFPVEPLESLKQKAAADKRLVQERPSFRAAVATRQTLYSNTPLGRVITPESIIAVTRDELVNLHRNLLLSLQPAIYIAGAVTPEILKTIENSFGNLEVDTTNPNAIKYTPVNYPEPTQLTEVEVDMPTSLQTAIKYHLPTIRNDHPDFEALRMAVMILGGYFGSRLMTNLREEHGYTYGASAQLVVQSDCASISITTDCDNSYALRCVEEINREIRRLAEVDVPAEELETARQIVLSSLSSVLDSPLTIEAYREMLAINRQPESALARRVDAVNRLVPADIRRVARRYLLDAPGALALAGGPR